MGSQLLALGNVPHPQAVQARILLQRFPVGVAGLAQRVQGLLADGVGRAQPQGQGRSSPEVSVGGHGMGAQQRLAAAGAAPASCKVWRKAASSPLASVEPRARAKNRARVSRVSRR